MRSQLVLGGRFRVFEDGSINKVFDGVETPAKQSATGLRGKYLTVSYTSDGKRKTAYVHCLIAAAFVDNPNNYPQVNHKDGDSRNNAVSNLEWVTASMNVRHAYETGLANKMATAEPCIHCGNFTISESSICPKCKISLLGEAREIDRRAAIMDRYSKIDMKLLNPSETKYVERACNGASVSEIAREFGVTKQCVSAALLFAEKKSSCVRYITKGQENKRVALLCKASKAKQKMDTAEVDLGLAKANYIAAENALLLFEQSLTHNGVFLPQDQNTAMPVQQNSIL